METEGLLASENGVTVKCNFKRHFQSNSGQPEIRICIASASASASANANANANAQLYYIGKIINPCRPVWQPRWVCANKII